MMMNGELAGFTIPRLGMGTMALAIEGRPDRDTAIRTIHAGLDAGVRYLDTAWSVCPILQNRTQEQQKRGPPWCVDSQFSWRPALHLGGHSTKRAHHAPTFRRTPNLSQCRYQARSADNTTKPYPNSEHPRPNRHESYESRYRDPGAPQSPKPSFPYQAEESQILPTRRPSSSSPSLQALSRFAHVHIKTNPT